MFLKNKNIISKIRRSKVTDYAALIETWKLFAYMCGIPNSGFVLQIFLRWISCAYTQILNRGVEIFCVHAQKLLYK